jgi:flagellar hook protein FlgE
VYNSNGYPTGKLQEYSIGNDGIITGIYSNGKQQMLGMIALAYFENPTGLKSVGDSSYTQTANSGEFRAVVPGEEAGSLTSNTLEMSNVDLSTEFTNLIVYQRGFQANSRTITTADEMLQELVNLKR